MGVSCWFWQPGQYWGECTKGASNEIGPINFNYDTTTQGAIQTTYVLNDGTSTGNIDGMAVTAEEDIVCQDCFLHAGATLEFQFAMANGYHVRLLRAVATSEANANLAVNGTFSAQIGGTLFNKQLPVPQPLMPPITFDVLGLELTINLDLTVDIDVSWKVTAEMSGQLSVGYTGTHMAGMDCHDDAENHFECVHVHSHTGPGLHNASFNGRESIEFDLTFTVTPTLHLDITVESLLTAGVNFALSPYVTLAILEEEVFGSSAAVQNACGE